MKTNLKPFQKNHFWVFGLVLKNNINRDNLQKKLANKGIETRPFFWPLHLQKALNLNQKLQNLNISELIGKNGLYIPMGKHVKKSDQQIIVNEIKNAIRS